MKKRWWTVAAGVILVGGGFLAAEMLRGDPAPAAAQEGTETATVRRGTLLVTVEGSGSLQALNEVVVPVETGGRVVEVLVRTGAVVESGDVLVRLDATDAQQAVDNARLSVEQSEVSLASAQLALDELATWEAEEHAVAQAEASLAAAEVAYQNALRSSALAGDQITSAEVSLAQAQRGLEDAVAAYDTAHDPGRDWELGDRFRSAQIEAEREAADGALEAAHDSLTVAQASYNLAVVGVGDSGVSSAWSQVVSAQKSLDDVTSAPDDDDIEAARLQVAQSEIALEQAQLQLTSAEQDLADTVLVASAGGTVVQVDLELGQMVSNGQTGVILADLDTLEVEIGLDESDVTQVTVGQSAIVTLDAFDDMQLAGVIDHVAPSAQSQSGVALYQVTVVLDPTEVAVRPGMTADVELVTSGVEDVLVIPLKAVQSADGKSYAQVRSADGSFERVQIELGLMMDAQVEVLSGLEEGDVVLLAAAAEPEVTGFPGPMGMMGRQ